MTERTADRIVQDLRDIIRAEQSRQENNHQHLWKIRGVNRYTNQATRSDHPRYDPSKELTLVLLRCEHCRIIIVHKLDGHWSDVQLGVNDAPTN